MKQLIKFSAFFFIILFVIASCKKNYTSSNHPAPVTNNQPPVAMAGFDQTITLPDDSIELTGTGTDPDRNIVSYSWSKISGPSSFTIVYPNNAVTKI